MSKTTFLLYGSLSVFDCNLFGELVLDESLTRAAVKGHLSRKLVPMGDCHSTINCIMKYTRWKNRIICCWLHWESSMVLFMLGGGGESLPPSCVFTVWLCCSACLGGGQLPPSCIHCVVVLFTVWLCSLCGCVVHCVAVLFTVWLVHCVAVFTVWLLLSVWLCCSLCDLFTVWLCSQCDCCSLRGYVVHCVAVLFTVWLLLTAWLCCSLCGCVVHCMTAAHCVAVLFSSSWWGTTASWDLWWCARRQRGLACPSHSLSASWCWVSAPSVCRCSTACTPLSPTSHPTSSTRGHCRMASLPVGTGLVWPLDLLVDTMHWDPFFKSIINLQ